MSHATAAVLAAMIVGAVLPKAGQIGQANDAPKVWTGVPDADHMVWVAPGDAIAVPEGFLFVVTGSSARRILYELRLHDLCACGARRQRVRQWVVRVRTGTPRNLELPELECDIESGCATRTGCSASRRQEASHKAQDEEEEEQVGGSPPPSAVLPGRGRDDQRAGELVGDDGPGTVGEAPGGCPDDLLPRDPLERSKIAYSSSTVFGYAQGQPACRPEWGCRGRRFESSCPDHSQLGADGASIYVDWKGDPEIPSITGPATGGREHTRILNWVP